MAGDRAKEGYALNAEELRRLAAETEARSAAAEEKRQEAARRQQWDDAAKQAQRVQAEIKTKLLSFISQAPALLENAAHAGRSAVECRFSTVASDSGSHSHFTSLDERKFDSFKLRAALSRFEADLERIPEFLAFTRLCDQKGYQVRVEGVTSTTFGDDGGIVSVSVRPVLRVSF